MKSQWFLKFEFIETLHLPVIKRPADKIPGIHTLSLTLQK